MLLREGSPSAFATIYDQCYKRLFAEAYSHLNNIEEAEDMVQEVFIWLWQERSRLDIHSSLRGYLVRIVKYKSIDAIRKREQTHRRKQQFNQLFSSEAVLPPSRIEQQELQQELHHAIEGISSTQSRYAFKLMYVEEKSGREIALEMGLKVQSVKNLLQHARKVLRKKLIKPDL